jgi:polysaccharide export outer membrane protein
MSPTTSSRCLRSLGATALVVGFVLFAGCPSTAPGGYANIRVDIQAMMQSATLGPGDVFEVRIYQEKDLSGIYRVSPAGQIDFPHIGTLTVEGLSAGQVAELIRRKLADGFIRNPYVTVTIQQFNSKKIFVLGQVARPGRLNYEDNMSIVEAVTLAGGFAPVAEKNYTIVTRVEDGVEKRIPVPVEKIMQGLAKNFLLKPGDIVFVPESAF